MATNWNAILSNANSLADILMILRKVLAGLDGKADTTLIDEALEDIEKVKSDVADEIEYFKKVINESVENGLYVPFTTQAELLAYVPDTEPVVGKAFDTFNVWIWETRDPDNTPIWHDTGLSELAQAQRYVDGLINKSTNLFIDSTSVKNNQYVDANGNVVTAIVETDWAYTDFIEVIPTRFNYYDGFRYVAFYDKSKNFVSRSSISENATKYSAAVGVPINAYYARACYRTSVADYLSTGRMINVGPTIREYEIGGYRLNNQVTIKDVNYQNKSISVEKLSFIDKSKNLFDSSSVTFGSIVSATGTIDDAADYAVSDFIEIESGTRYTVSCDTGYNHFASLAYYNANKEFISRISTTSTNPFTFISHYTAKFVRLNINMNSGLPSQRKRMFNVGGTALPYEAYFVPKLQNVGISHKAVDEIYEISALKNRIKKSNNLFNYNAVTPGKVISSTGEISNANDYAISDFIKVSGGAKYTISNDANYSAFVTTAYYDKDKVFISRANTPSTSGSLTITIPKTASYLRFNINLNSGKVNQRNRMFNAGTVALAYEMGGAELRDIILSDDVIKQIEEKINITSEGNLFSLDLPIDNPFYTDAVWDEFSDFRTIQSDQVYAMYDDLMSQHPLFITKYPLANNSVGQPIAYYKFTPRLPPVDIASSRKLPKVFLLCGIHGMEHTPPLATFLMLREMYNNWQSDPLLESLRHNVEFVVIPVANPDGWNKFTRANPNGVDLNRNYSEGWVYRTDPGFYSGEYPFSEIETQNVRQVFNENTDIDIFFDFHNFNGSSPETHPHVIWVSALSNDKQMARMAQCLITRMTRHWRRKYSFIPPEPYVAGIFDSGPHAGMSASYAKTRGPKISATFELGNRWWIDPSAVPHDAIHKRTTTEAITNWMLITIKELLKI